MCAKLNIEVATTAGESPFSNGTVERHNKRSEDIKRIYRKRSKDIKRIYLKFVITTDGWVTDKGTTSV